MLPRGLVGPEEVQCGLGGLVGVGLKSCISLVVIFQLKIRTTADGQAGRLNWKAGRLVSVSPPGHPHPHPPPLSPRLGRFVPVSAHYRLKTFMARSGEPAVCFLTGHV